MNSGAVRANLEHTRNATSESTDLSMSKTAQTNELGATQMIYELSANGKVIANSGNLEWIVNVALPFHQKHNRYPVIFSSRHA